MGKHVKQNKNQAFLYIVIIGLLISVFAGLTYARYVKEFDQDTFDIEFIAGNIKLELSDSAEELVIVPGKEIAKDTKVIVKANSEACYLFVKLEKSNDFDSFIDYEIAGEWKPLADNTDVYYCELDKTTSDTDIYIVNNHQINVKDTITQEEMESLNENLTINFTAYAVQKTSEITDATVAWNTLNNS